MMLEKRDFLEIPDLTADELYDLLALARRVKAGEFRGAPLAGKTVAMIFEKSSTRTRVSFEVGTFQLGGHALFLPSRDIQLSRGEPISDTARVLSGYVDAIVIRTFAHADIQELAHYATVPVINALTDLLHPCQVLADVMTMQEEFGEDLTGRRVAWIGDGNNMANSWINAAYRFGLELRLACPPGFEPDKAIFERARTAANVQLMHDPRRAVDGAEVVSTDVWASMGQEGEAEERRVAFRDFTVDDDLMALADPKAIFLHCLPAHRGEEVTAEVIDGPRSRVFEEAANRLHLQKALLIDLLGG